LPRHSIKYEIYSEYVTEHPDCIGFNMKYVPDKNYIEYLSHFENSGHLALTELRERLNNMVGHLDGTKSGNITNIKIIGETMTVTNLLVEYIKQHYPKITYINTSTDSANAHVLYIRHNSTPEQMENYLKELINLLDKNMPKQ
jgi:DNA-directed RNA polymerase subunit L